MRRIAIIVALAVSSWAVVSAPAGANVPRVTVADRPGAPGNMLRQLEELAGQPLGDVRVAFAVETGGRRLSTAQIDALLAGREVEGARVLGAMTDSRELLGTTFADLSDGRVDGPRGGAAPTSTIMFASSVPGGREWCLTMCMASGKTLMECIRERTGHIDLFGLDLSGETTLGGTSAAFTRAGGVSWGQLRSAQTLIGEGDPSAEDINVLLDGGDVGSLRRVAEVDSPDAGWRLGELAEKSGVAHARTTVHIFTTYLPWFGKVLAVCVSRDDGTTWKCGWKQWNGF
jgi:hypothetical protein